MFACVCAPAVSLLLEVGMSVVLTGGRRQPQVLSTLSLFANPAARHRAAAARPPPSLCVRVPEWKNGRVPDTSNHGRAEVSSRLTALSLTLSPSEFEFRWFSVALGVGCGLVRRVGLATVLLLVLHVVCSFGTWY